MSKTSRITSRKRTMIKSMKRGKTSGYQARNRIFTRENRFFLLMGLFFTVYISYILYLDFDHFVLRENWPAPRTSIARVDFRCLDIERMEEEARNRASLVPTVYYHEDNWGKDILRAFESFADAAGRDTEQLEISQRRWKESFSTEFPAEFAGMLKSDPAKTTKLRTTVKAILETFERTGVIGPRDLETVKGEHILISRGAENDKVRLESLPATGDVVAALERSLQRQFGQKISGPFLQLIRSDLKASLMPSEHLTEAERAEERKKVKAVFLLVTKGTVMVNGGELITNAVAVTLEAEQQAYRGSLQPMDRVKMVLGNLLFTAVFVIILALYMSFFEADINLSPNKLFLYFLLIMLFLVLGKVFYFFGLPMQAVPIIFIAMISAIIINSRFAVVMTILLSLITASIFKVDIESAIALFAGAVVGVFFCGRVRRRVTILEGGVIAGLINAAVIYGVNFARNVTLGPAWFIDLAGLLSGTVSGILLIGILPLIEYLFDTATDIRLLELSDQGHPLLRNLFLQASGTYTHSLGVGNLSESAAGAIGANALLARVASYYHDIGKIFKPEYFIENQSIGGNKHDRLKPGLSSLIIASHTRDGVDLGSEYKLPGRILDIMAEHHGTGKIVYFLQKAQSQARENEAVDEGFFRYPGPKPGSRESGIVMMADSIEAASRTLTNPSPSSLRKIVARIINHKMEDGQLDETGLTMVELTRIKESFITVLFGIFHARIEYPEDSK